MPAADSGGAPPEPASLRRLRRLVTALTLVLIVGMVTITGLLAWRLTRPAPPPRLPETLALPAGETLESFALGPRWTVLITRDAAGAARVHVLAAGGERILATVRVEEPR